jgi:hypothetical protein
VRIGLNSGWSVVGGSEKILDSEILKTTTVALYNLAITHSPIPTLCYPRGYIWNPTSLDP